MEKPISKLAKIRQNGSTQVVQQRASILNAAEKLFLQRGILNTQIIDIAAEAGITKPTLYRYFPNRDTLALEIHIRMMRQIDAVIAPSGHDLTLEGEKKRAQSMIRNFNQLRNAFRYLGMFDQVYLDNLPENAQAQWAKSELASNWAHRKAQDHADRRAHGKELSVIKNSIIWFLEKLALRGELTWSQSDSMEEDLRIFEDLVMGYFDKLMDA